MLNSADYTSQLGVPPAAFAGLGRVTLFRSAWLPHLTKAASGLETRRESGVSRLEVIPTNRSIWGSNSDTGLGVLLRRDRACPGLLGVV